MTPAPKVFVSYSHLDRQFATSIAETLRARGIEVWFDEWRLKVGDSLISELERGIMEADFLVLLISRQSASSRWVREEYEAAKMRELRPTNSFRLLPVVIDETEPPLFLASRIYADFKSSFASGCIKLLASILGDDNLNRIDKAFFRFLSAPRNDVLLQQRIVSPVPADLVDEFTGVVRSRSKTVGTSARALEWRADGRVDLGEIVEDRVSQLIRDFRQYKLYFDALALLSLHSDGAALTLREFVDRLFEGHTSLERRYGDSRNAAQDEWVARDLDRMLSRIAVVVETTCTPQSGVEQSTPDNSDA